MTLVPWRSDTAAATPPGIRRRIGNAVLEVLATIPVSSEPSNTAPAARAAQLAASAAKKAAGISGGAALVPGPLGLLSLLPDVIGVWRVQAQMVADIAAAHGKTGALTTEAMLYCLFKHLLSQGLRDLVVRAGERYVVRAASSAVLRRIAAAVGVKVSQHSLGKLAARYAPLVGALGVGAYAYYDTRRVARTATALFAGEVVLEPTAL